MQYKKMIPRHGDIGRVLKLGRVSTHYQNVTNIQASYHYLDPIAAAVFDCEFEIRELGEQASGMSTQRQTIIEASLLVDERWPDLILLEDVSKSYRNPRWIYAFIQDCVDAEIRVIAPGDNLDTYEDNWEVSLATAAMRHGLHIPDTRRRVRRTSAYAFENGGMVLRVKFGYKKVSKEEAASGRYGPIGLRLAKDPSATPTIREMRDKVVNDNYGGELLARWLREEGIATGSNVTSGRWTASLVLSLLRDPLLYGMRQFPKVTSNPQFSDGTHKRKKNPTPKRRLHPELAHITEEGFNQMQMVLDKLGTFGKGRKRRSGQQHPRHGVVRTKAVFPMQHATCLICGQPFYQSGNGAAKCMRSLKRQAEPCWNHVTLNITLARQKIVDLLLARLQADPQIMQLFIDAVFQQIRQTNSRSERSVDNINKEILNYQKQAERVTDAIVEGGRSTSLTARLKTIEKSIKTAVQRKKELEDAAPEHLPSSPDKLLVNPRPALLELAATSFEFGALMRKIFPTFEIQPVQALDCPLVRARALLTLDLGRLQPADTDPSLRTPPEKVTFDVFEPNIHIHHLKAAVALNAIKLQAGEKVSLKILAGELGIGRMTVRRAIQYHQLMTENEMIDPYRVLTQIPLTASRWKPRVPKKTAINAETNPELPPVAAVLDTVLPAPSNAV